MNPLDPKSLPPVKSVISHIDFKETSPEQAPLREERDLTHSYVTLRAEGVTQGFQKGKDPFGSRGLYIEITGPAAGVGCMGAALVKECSREGITYNYTSNGKDITPRMMLLNLLLDTLEK